MTVESGSVPVQMITKSGRSGKKWYLRDPEPYGSAVRVVSNRKRNAMGSQLH
jgi:hypothetical protein